jgi:hypothetical protein
MISRVVVRLGLFIALCVSVTAIATSIFIAGPRSTEVWATIAAALAVITSILSSWSAQRVLELAEDEQQPYPYPSIDVQSRYELMQLRVTNFGGSAAHDIWLRWDTPLLHPKGQIVRFTKNENVPDIPVLLPKESASILVGGSHEMFQKYTGMNYTGRIDFADAAGRRRSLPFRISAETYRSSLTYTEEEPRTHYDLQRIPKEIEKLTGEVRSLRDGLQQLGRGPHAGDE